jgi:hypothetical protein
MVQEMMPEHSNIVDHKDWEKPILFVCVGTYNRVPIPVVDFVRPMV